MRSIRKKYKNDYIQTELSNTYRKPFLTKDKNNLSIKNEYYKKFFLETFKSNKKKYDLSSTIKLDNYKSENKKKDKKIVIKNFKINKLNKTKNDFKTVSTSKKLKLLNKNSNNKINLKNKKLKFFRTIKNEVKSSINLKLYQSIKIKENLKDKINNQNYNNYFKSFIIKNKKKFNNNDMKKITKKLKDYFNSDIFRLIFKKKEIEQLMEFENSVLNINENFKKLDFLYEEILNKQKWINYKNKIKKSFSKYKLLKQRKSFIFKDIYYNNTHNWKNILLKVLNYCLLDKFKHKIEDENNLNKTFNSIKFVKKIKKSQLKRKIKTKNKRVFNKENKLVNGKYISSWLNIIENTNKYFDYDLNNEIGYYKIKDILNQNKNECKSLNILKYKNQNSISELNNLINKIEEDLNLDHKLFKIK